MVENKVVIRVNVKKNATPKASSAPEVITVWHTGRIIGVIAPIVILLLYLLLRACGSVPEQETQPVPLAQPVTEVGRAASEESVSSIPAKANQSVKQVHQSTVFDPKHPSAIIFDRRVLRASLNTGLKNNEPNGLVKSPVKLAEHQTLELYYFNDLVRCYNKQFLHVWSKDGKPVYKKSLVLKDSHGKIVSSHKMTQADRGQWQIQLVDNTGKVYSENNFSVDYE